MKSRSGLILGWSAAALTLASTVTASATAVTVGNLYQEGSERASLTPPSSGGCINTNLCHVLFNVVPSGKQLLIKDVSCNVQASGTNSDTIYLTDITTTRRPVSGLTGDTILH